MLKLHNQIINTHQQSKCLYCFSECKIHIYGDKTSYQYSCPSCYERYIICNYTILHTFSNNNYYVQHSFTSNHFTLWNIANNDGYITVPSFGVDFSNKEKLLHKIKMCFIFQ